MAAPAVHRTRIVCISDTHNCTVKLPEGDVLIHAGDLTNQGSFSEISRAVKWLEEADFQAKIVIAGNHDITLDETFYSQHGHAFHNNSKTPQSSEECLNLFSASRSITYLNHESATIRLDSAKGAPLTQFTVFGSPYSPRYGQWAFYYDDAVKANPGDASPLTTIWDDIPFNTDIVVTHTPPRNHGDATTEQRPKGCEALRRALWRVQPRLAVCGHIHDGRGAHRVVWDKDPQSSIGFAEKSVSVWTDPGAGSNKLSLVDLTAKKGLSLAKDETCVVNAAVLKSRYPHREGKQFNKPIVVDIDLPAWATG
ncbi:hypothetical protein E4U55_004431 [Claviceps digitariae]|nr:hypothetical protein E4U55_004431 [Claviceps digitariae]